MFNMRRNRPLRALACSALIGAAAIGCSNTADDAEPRQSAARDELDRNPLSPYLSWGREIVLEEDTAVINVEPIVTVDTNGDLLIADEQESQIRVYSPTGQLLTSFGRKGQGPSEFNAPLGAHRRSSGEIVVIDSDGKGVVFSPDGSEVKTTFRIPLSPIYATDMISDSLFVVAGRRPGEIGGDLLHLLNLNSLSLGHSFFPPPPVMKNKGAELMVGFVDVAARGDTIAAVYSVSDTVYLFGIGGNLRDKVPLNSDHFRLATSDPPPPGSPIKAIRDWVSSFSMMSHVFWTRNGNLLVQYQDRDGTIRKWRLTEVARDGTPVFDVTDTPRLLGSRGDSTFYFVSPDAEAPNRWVTASLVH